MTLTSIIEPARELTVMDSADVVICGGGPAGIAAAIAAARQGASTLLIESTGCLGGIWTSGLMPYILGYSEQPGIITEIKKSLQAAQTNMRGADKILPSPETVKLLLEQMCLEAGVRFIFHSKVCGAQKESDKITHVIIESPNGRQAIKGKVFIDCTGNGELGAHSGCGFDIGKADDGSTQPMSLIALLTGIHSSEIKEFISGTPDACENLYNELKKGGIEPSYSRASLFQISNDTYLYMGNHQYKTSCMNVADMTKAIIKARAELSRHVQALRSRGGCWTNLQLTATAAQIGIREGRRLHGLYTLTMDDLISGKEFPDAVCKVQFGMDVHALSSDSNRGLTDISENNPVQPYDIPLRALISRDCDNLLMAGRCISGDFYAHASYRVTGIAVPCGEGAGICAAQSVKHNISPKYFVPV
jgi:FAD dependent oxidoreductase